MGGGLIAKVALEAATFALDRPFDYRVPQELAGRVAPGMRVVVPFGAGNRRSEGLVLALSAESALAKLKPILRLLDDRPVLDESGVKLALWLRERCFCTVYAAARAMLPAGLWFELRSLVSVAPGIDREAAFAAAGRSKHAARIVELVYAAPGGLELDRLREAFGEKDPNPALKQLLDAGVLALDAKASRQVGDKTRLLARLAVPAEEAMAKVTPRRGSAPLRYSVIQLLCAMGNASVKELCYFTGASPATLRSLEKSGLVTLERQEVYRRSPPQVPPAPPVELNGEQETAFHGLEALTRTGKPEAALLYGVTGSGKTLVYIRLIQRVLESGRTALVLVPEISLTPQLLERFAAHFGDRVAVLHSMLRAGERYDEWKRVRAGQARVAVGTRSAVFAPLPDLGLIILDEEQESSYKSEQSPRYHARDVARFRCAQQNALLLLGSATPAVETMYLADQGVYHRFTLGKRYHEQALPEVRVADLKAELKSGNGGSVSALLREELAVNLERGEQSILFLNRRGASRMVACGECGQAPVCPRCSVHLTYHSANGRLMCHYCGHSEKLPEACPDCGGLLSFVGSGTQRVQAELERLFPGVEVLRMDADTVSARNTHEAMLARFEQKKIPILLGTQMVTKGLDFENVTLVGVIDADLSLYVDSFRAAERTFSLLTQVAGRAGRGRKRGRAVIQTLTPENDVIRLAARQDYGGFYSQELALRRLRRCPPFADLCFVTAAGPEEHAVLRACLAMRDMLSQWLAAPPYDALALEILGPAPAAVAKVNNRYRYRLTLWGKDGRLLRALVAHLLRTAQEQRENRGISIFADMNPMD